MPDPKNVSWRLALLGLLLGGLLATGALALASWAGAPDAPEEAAPPAAHEEEMPPDEQCAHMPEHCAPPEDG